MRKKYNILCVHCRKHLYDYYGEFEGPFDLRNFEPANSGIPKPGPGEAMMCLRCGNSFYMLTHRGSIIVMTNEGFKPRAPSGAPHVFVPDDTGYIIPELPPNFGEDESGEFREPT